MRMQKCKNAHFYDADKNSSCPYCRQMAGAKKTTVADLDFSTLDDDLFESIPLASASPAPKKPADTQKTVFGYADTVGFEPVVGWLVCTKGKHYGKSFPLKAGRNFIGRDASMDVALANDQSVSRDRHAIVTYDPKANCFFVQPGEARSLFYLNSEVVLSNQKLASYDVLSIGEENLLFLALCGTRFRWENTRG